MRFGVIVRVSGALAAGSIAVAGCGGAAESARSGSTGEGGVGATTGAGTTTGNGGASVVAAASGTTGVGTTGAGGSVEGAQLGWQELPNTMLQSACPPDGFLPQVSDGKPYPFSYDCHMVIGAWGGGVADTKRDRLIIWGGGHVDYAGNEVYSLNLEASPVTLTRLNDPSGPAVYDNNASCAAITSSTFPFQSGTVENNWAMPDGRPNTRHTTASLVYLPAPYDRMFVQNGGVACGNGVHYFDTWTLDLANVSNTGAGGWTQMDPAKGTQYFTGAVQDGSWWSVSDWDPNSGKTIVNNNDAVYSYDYATNTYAVLTQNAHFPVAGNAVVDPKRKLFVELGVEWPVGGTPNDNHFVTTVSLVPPYTVTDITAQVQGCGPAPAATYPGMAYDPVVDRIVIWPNTGSTVYLFNPDTKSCTAQTFATAPPDVGNLVNANGAIGRFRYFPDLDAFALVADATKNAFLLRIDNSMP